MSIWQHRITVVYVVMENFLALISQRVHQDGAPLEGLADVAVTGRSGVTSVGSEGLCCGLVSNVMVSELVQE